LSNSNGDSSKEIHPPSPLILSGLGSWWRLKSNINQCTGFLDNASDNRKTQPSGWLAQQNLKQRRTRKLKRKSNTSNKKKRKEKNKTRNGKNPKKNKNREKEIESFERNHFIG
jgi:hypothetical protein